MPTRPKTEARFTEPMLAKLVEKPPTGDGWQYELKLDGYRAEVVKRGNAVEVFSRRGNFFTRKYPTIAAAFEGLSPDTVLDGEIVALDQNGRPDFQELQNWRPSKPVYFYAFDMLTHAGRDIRGLPLAERRDMLQKVLSRVSDPVRFSPTFDCALDDLIHSVREHGLEGIVAKKRDSRYDAGKRTDAWLKYKTPRSRELIIAGYLAGSFKCSIRCLWDIAKMANCCSSQRYAMGLLPHCGFALRNLSRDWKA